MFVLLLLQLYAVPATNDPEGVTDATVPPLQVTWFDKLLTLGVGLTVSCHVLLVPVQVTLLFVKEGVTVNVPEIAELPVLVPANAGTVPLPLPPIPIAVFVLVQLYTVPDTVPVKLTAFVLIPLQTVWFAIGPLTVALGLTVILKLVVLPAHATLLFVKVGVTITLPVIGPVVVLVPKNDAILPEPGEARPIAVLLLVQANVVPLTVLLKLMVLTGLPWQTVCGNTVLITGIGLTVITKPCGVPVQVILLLV
jgi:hypothetical protein